jgi:hypothetical protein
MYANRVLSVFTVASQLGFPFPDPDQGRPSAENPAAWLGRFTRRRGAAGPGIFLGHTQSDCPGWYLEFEDGIDEVTRARCRKVLGAGLILPTSRPARTSA